MSKKFEGKPEPTLVYSELIEAIARVRRYGIEKHGTSEDWRSTPRVLHFDAMLRHVYAYMRGEDKDVESGLPHLWHAAANIMFEIVKDAQGAERVDWLRVKSSVTPSDPVDSPKVE